MSVGIGDIAVSGLSTLFFKRKVIEKTVINATSFQTPIERTCVFA